MHRSTLLVSLVGGVLAFLLATVVVTELLAPYLWPSLLVGLPVGVAVGLATVPVGYFALRWRAERRTDRGPSASTTRRLRASVAGALGFLAGGALAVGLLWGTGGGLATIVLLGGVPVGLLTAILAAILGWRSVDPNTIDPSLVERG